MAVSGYFQALFIRLLRMAVHAINEQTKNAIFSCFLESECFFCNRTSQVEFIGYED